MKKKVLTSLEKDLQKRQKEAHLKFLLSDDKELFSDVENSSSDDSDASTLEYLMKLRVIQAKEKVESQRYFGTRKSYRNGHAVFERDLVETDNDQGVRPWLQDDEFLAKYRMHRESFHGLVGKIKDHPVFQPSLFCRKKQAPVEHQLMVFLAYLGTSGSGANNPRLRNVFGIGRGTVEVYKRRCTAAISSLRNEAIQWPNVAERKEIALHMMLEHDFINCIGIADGTLFPLTYEPRSKDAPDYHGRKFRYSLSVMIINDDKKRIRAYLSGFPGCAHDNRVYKAMDLAQNPQKYFGRFYYLVADSAFSNTSSVVSSFRKPAGANLTEEQEKFNTILGSLRVRSEHTIGILKARFPWLQSIPMIITDKVNSVRAILRVIDCCVILHNLLLDANDDVPQAWLDDLSDDASDIGEAVGEYEFAGNIRDNNSDERRQYILDYFRDQRLV